MIPTASINETTALAYEKWFFANAAVTELEKHPEDIEEAHFIQVVNVRDMFWNDYQDHLSEQRANR